MGKLQGESLPCASWLYLLKAQMGTKFDCASKRSLAAPFGLSDDPVVVFVFG